MGGVSGRVNTTCLLALINLGRPFRFKCVAMGIVETGEDCDPGSGLLPNVAMSKPASFKNGAQCDPGSSACSPTTAISLHLLKVCRLQG